MYQSHIFHISERIEVELEIQLYNHNHVCHFLLFKVIYVIDQNQLNTNCLSFSYNSNFDLKTSTLVQDEFQNDFQKRFSWSEIRF